MSLAVPSYPTTTAQPATVALFVSDLHLTSAMPQTAARFFSFLRDVAVYSKQLYLLGDIFEYWAGDDDMDEPFNRSVIDALRATHNAGVELFWLAGNRDFLAGQAFAHACGAVLLDEPYVITIGNQPILLVHGDAQCTDDEAYMAFRKQVRDPKWQQHFLSQPLAQRKAIIAQMRAGSRDAQMSKAMDIMDVNAHAIRALFDQHKVSVMIHGHTHRPARHQIKTDSGELLRYVLPDWDFDGATYRGGWIAMDSSGRITQTAADHPANT